MSLLWKSARVQALVVFLIAVGSLAVAVFLEHYANLEPCPLCIMQRVAFAGSAIFALAAALSRPRGVFAAFAGLGAAVNLAGLGIALRHIWVGFHPGSGSCSPYSLGEMASRFPVGKWLPRVLAGEAECAAAAKWTLLGLNLPEWAAILFVLGTLVLARAVVARFAQRPKIIY